MHKNLREAVNDLRQQNELLDINFEVDPVLEMAEIHRRIFDKQGPAILFNKVKGSPFPALSNLYGTWERTSYLFRKTLPSLKELIRIKIAPERLLKNPLMIPRIARTAIRSIPRKRSNPAVLYQQTSIDQLPNIVSWPMDGGGFVTLPQVMSYPPDDKNIMQTNIGMYRIQLNGNDYIPNEEIGLHYQIHRGIGVHHKAYLEQNKSFKVAIGIGGPPAQTVASIMPLPEGMSETIFSGLLGGRRYAYGEKDDFLFPAEADFVIFGEVYLNKEKPEGPFGDHLGYYSLTHPFPYMKVESVWHRKDPIWHFTVVGRPPAEDSYFGKLIHEVVGDIGKAEFPGMEEVLAVDAAGVHPLLLAIGKERYMPFRSPGPEEILTIANHLLGKGQTSLAKYLIIANRAESKSITTKDIRGFLNYVLERIDLARDLHFYTNWTMDTLDYSGHGMNAGSKLVIAASGPKIRNLSTEITSDIVWPKSIVNIEVVQAGILALETSKFISYEKAQQELAEICAVLESSKMENYPLLILCDDAKFLAKDQNNFVWATFTRSNPAKDIYGLHSSFENKHWVCRESMIIDARIKTHHAPPLIIDPEISKKVDEYFKKGAALEKYG